MACTSQFRAGKRYSVVSRARDLRESRPRFGRAAIASLKCVMLPSHIAPFIPNLKTLRRRTVGQWGIDFLLWLLCRTRHPFWICPSVNVLLIPAMSVEAERVFSGARRTISWERMKLGEDTIEKVECLKHWKKNGVIRTGSQFNFDRRCGCHKRRLAI